MSLCNTMYKEQSKTHYSQVAQKFAKVLILISVIYNTKRPSAAWQKWKWYWYHFVLLFNLYIGYILKSNGKRLSFCSEPLQFINCKAKNKICESVQFKQVVRLSSIWCQRCKQSSFTALKIVEWISKVESYPASSQKTDKSRPLGLR